MTLRNKYLAVNENCVLRRLEKRYVYHIVKDELFEVNRRAYNFLLKLDGSQMEEELIPDPEFMNYCVKEKLVDRLAKQTSRPPKEALGTNPSMRYLELLITRRCSRECKHCYLGKPKPIDMPTDRVLDTLTQFEKMGGLRVLLSGGEPMSHPHFEKINEALPQFGLRKVLLTNGDFFTKAVASSLNVHEVQVSVDGLEKGHDYLRGKGSFKKAIAAIENAKEAGLEISVATILHKKNLNEIEKLKEKLAPFKLREWSIDAPVTRGLSPEALEDFASVEETAELASLGYGGSYHGGSEGYVCGRHLGAVAANGDVLKCGFFTSRPLGTVENGGLRASWLKKSHEKLWRISCKFCKFMYECGGGCRYRAVTERDRDLAMCARFGVTKGPDYTKDLESAEAPI